jgi:hypothetical protein
MVAAVLNPSTPIKMNRLHATTAAVCPIIGVSVPTVGTSVGVTFTVDASATAAQITAAQNNINAFDWSDPADASWKNLQDRSSAINIYSTLTHDQAKLYRAVMLVAVDELNILRQWLTSFKAAVAAATSLADLQTRVAALPATPDRTPTQAVNAITNKINSGTVD